MVKSSPAPVQVRLLFLFKLREITRTTTGGNQCFAVQWCFLLPSQIKFVHFVDTLHTL